MVKKLQAYNNDPEIKEQFISKMTKHIELDKLQQRKYSNCFIGCLFQYSSLSDLPEYFPNFKKRVETESGIPVQIIQIAETIFENYPDQIRNTFQTFALETLKIINVGIDYYPVLEQIEQAAKEIFKDEDVSYSYNHSDFNLHFFKDKKIIKFKNKFLKILKEHTS